MTGSCIRSLPALLLAALLVPAASLHAGPIFVPGQLDGQQIHTGPGRPVPLLRHPLQHVQRDRGQGRGQGRDRGSHRRPGQARPRRLPNPAAGRRTTAPASASPGPGRGRRQRSSATRSSLSSAKAQEVYEAIARGGLTKILAFTGRPAILVPAVDLGGKGKMSITFRLAIKSTQGMHTLTCPMPAAGFAAAPGRARHRQRPPHEQAAVAVHLQPDARDDRHAQNAHRGDGHRQGRPLDRHGGLPPLLGGRQRRPRPARAGLPCQRRRRTATSCCWATRPAPPPSRRCSKDVLFVMDTSGSMRGEKIEQARAALDYCIQHLDRTDRFNIVTFGTDVKTFKNDLVDATADNRKAAREFIEDVVAHGQTNIAGALQKALAGKADGGARADHDLRHRRCADGRRALAGEDRRASHQAERRDPDLRDRRRQRRQRAPARPPGRGYRRLQRVFRAAARNSMPRWPRCTTACRTRCYPA